MLCYTPLFLSSFLYIQGVFAQAKNYEGNQDLKNELVIQNGDTISYVDGSEYNFGGGIVSSQEGCTFRAVANDKSDFDFNVGKEFVNYCNFELINKNLDGFKQTINFSPAVFKNYYQVDIQLAHTRSDAVSKLILGSPEIINAGKLTVRPYSAVEQNDPSREGNILQISTPGGRLVNTGTIELSLGVKYYLYGDVSGTGNINIARGILHMETTSFVGNTINLGGISGISVKSTSSNIIKVRGLISGNLISSIGDNGSFTYNNQTGIVTVNTDSGRYVYDIGCGYDETTLGSTTGYIVYHGESLKTFVIATSLETAPDYQKCYIPGQNENHD